MIRKNIDIRLNTKKFLKEEKKSLIKDYQQLIIHKAISNISRHKLINIIKKQNKNSYIFTIYTYAIYNTPNNE